MLKGNGIIKSLKKIEGTECCYSYILDSGAKIENTVWEHVYEQKIMKQLKIYSNAQGELKTTGDMKGLQGECIFHDSFGKPGDKSGRSILFNVFYVGEEWYGKEEIDLYDTNVKVLAAKKDIVKYSGCTRGVLVMNIVAVCEHTGTRYKPLGINGIEILYYGDIIL